MLWLRAGETITLDDRESSSMLPSTGLTVQCPVSASPSTSTAEPRSSLAETQAQLSSDPSADLALYSSEQSVDLRMVRSLVRAISVAQC